MSLRSVRPSAIPSTSLGRRAAGMLAALLLAFPLALAAQPPGRALIGGEVGSLRTGDGERGTAFIFPVGIRGTVIEEDQGTLEGEFDVTMYELEVDTATPTRGPGAPIGTPYYGLPAIDYGDGSTVSTTTLALATPNGGPGGTNVYRGVGFRHTYPTEGSYDVTLATACCAGATGSLLYRVYTGTSFIGSYGPYPVSPSTLPDIVTGVAQSLTNLTFTTTFFYTSIVSFNGVLRYGVTNGVFHDTGRRGFEFGFDITEIPTVSEVGLICFGILLLGVGVVVLRRGVAG